jgi:transcriptional regulator with PAS, ATPase and Fis domain
MLTGESGTGKGLVAQAIHFHSLRRDKPMVSLNCGAMPENLLESELFGHMRGAFTGADSNKKGLLEVAERGSVFLDEIGEMSAVMQVKLLRVLQERRFRRVGGLEEMQADIRIIAATNQDLTKLIAEGRFREDLFYRINVIPIALPPLRDRREDIPAFLDHFLQVFSETYHVAPPRLSDEAIAQLRSAAWPGNVRQLRNIVERLVVRAHREVITPADLPREVLSMGVDPIGGESKAIARAAVDLLFERMVRNGETFWAAVYEPFMSRDLTRDDLRALVRQGLSQTRGGYKAVAALFNVPADHKKLLSFLRKHECHLPDADPRATPARFTDTQH